MSVIIDPKAPPQVPMEQALGAAVHSIKHTCDVTDCFAIGLNRRTGEFQIGCYPLDMNRQIELLEMALVRCKHKRGH